MSLVISSPCPMPHAPCPMPKNFTHKGMEFFIFWRSLSNGWF
ncbi:MULTISPECIES: hypothetical protein [Calothrix]|nr:MULTISPECIES: hypothetical protein [Calothrix]